MCQFSFALSIKENKDEKEIERKKYLMFLRVLQCQMKSAKNYFKVFSIGRVFLRAEFSLFDWWESLVKKNEDAQGI